LEKYVPVVARVHGEIHPEFLEVQRVFDRMARKLREAKSRVPELKEEFRELRDITNGYSVPDDACETYEAVYNMLAELDEAYHA
jgi:iron-sulfur cluster repair protein YtfE (RIC family)